MTIFDIAPLSAWRTLYKIAKSSVNNGTAPTQMRAILKADLLTWQLRRPYTHRNGETQPPDDEHTGYYWFSGTVTNSTSCYGISEMVKCWSAVVCNQSMLEILPKAAYVGHWWGPVMAPWGQGT